MQVFSHNTICSVKALVKAGRKHPNLTMLLIVIILIAITLLVVWDRQPTTRLNLPLVPSSSNQTGNLISGQDWSHMAGAKQTNEGISVMPVGLAIVNQDGTPGQANPPVNVNGPHVVYDGTVRIDARLKISSATAAAIQFYAAPPIIYDEWRYETPSVRISLEKNQIRITIWNGTSDAPAIVRSTQRSFDSETTITTVISKDSVAIYSGGQLIDSEKGHDTFRTGTIWFGADSTGGNFMIQSLAADAMSGLVKVASAPSLTVSQSDSGSLRNLAAKSRRKLPIGAAIATYPLLSNDSYRNLAGSQFNMLTPENAMKAQFIHPAPNTYTFEDADTLVNFARQNNMQVHGHALVFGEANPAWMQASPLTQRQQIMIDHISTVVGHYKGKVAEWDVVNEPLADNDLADTTSPDIRQTIWYQAMGEQYIDIAFKTAKQADPNAKLYINDFGLEADGDRWDSMINLLQRLKARGVPIDGVGFQAHVYESGDFVDKSVLERHMQQLAGMGLLSRVSEADVTGDDAQQQALQYQDLLSACIEVPTCTSFTTWGITDALGSTTTLHTYPLDYGNDLLWDENYHPKSALSALQNLLKSE